jgi:plastocyanin
MKEDRMNYLCPAVSLLTFLAPAFAGDVTVHAVITKRLSKKALSPVVYNLRGTAPTIAPSSTDPINEFDRVVLILEGGTAQSKGPVTAVIEQRNSRFDPELIVVPVGSTVQFPNWDPIFHNVFSLSKAQPFDLGFYPRGQSRTVKCNRAGIVQVYCHIHANMYAAIVVTASPWYGKPSADGSFVWNNVPAGHYRLTAWHKIAGMHRIEIDVPENGSVEGRIRIPIDVESQP